MQADLPLPEQQVAEQTLLPGSIWRRQLWSPRRRVLETRLYVVVEIEPARVRGRWFDTGRRSTLRRDRFRKVARFVALHDAGGGS